MNDLTGLSVEQMEERKLELAELAKTQDADLDAIEEEARAIATEIETRKAEEAMKVLAKQLKNFLRRKEKLCLTKKSATQNSTSTLTPST